MRLFFITHPDVVIDPDAPVPEWPLSDRGRERMQALLRLPWVPAIRAVYCSTEQKAIDGAGILAAHRGVKAVQMAALGENDRSSTGYLPEAEFQATADAFFARPEDSVRGWETARVAQRRIVAAVEAIAAQHDPAQDIAVVSHGGVGALLLCHLEGCAISRSREQPGTAGGHYFAFDPTSGSLLQGWMPIDWASV